MGHVPESVRVARTAALAPLFAVLHERGVKRTWLARQIGANGISLNSLWRYEHGYDRVPPHFLKEACKALGIPMSLIRIPEPRDLYIQQQPSPRTASRSASTKSAKSKTTTKRTATR